MIAIAPESSCAVGAVAAAATGSPGDFDLFLDLLPSIRRQARFAFRRWAEEAREEAVQEVIANAFVALARLIEQGKASLAYATPLAQYAVSQVRAGRRVGGKISARDVTSEGRRRRVKLARLDRWDPRQGAWCEILVEDPACTPAELAASRIDYPAFLATLSARNRQIAELLATGEKTSHVATRFGLSLARVSQLRQEFKAAWEAFHERGRAPRRAPSPKLHGC
jgi:hypothetical protein